MIENDDQELLGEGPLGGYAQQVPLESPYPAPGEGPLAPAAEPMVQEPVMAQPARAPQNYTQDEQSPDITPDHPAAPVAQQAPLVRVRSTTYGQGRDDANNHDPDTEAGRTSTGAPLISASEGAAGTAAVDPRIIPYGSIIRTADGRTYVAADTGGAVKSMKASNGRAPVIDLFSNKPHNDHPDYQDVQVFKPSADYKNLSPEDKLRYHEQAAQTFSGLAPGQHYKDLDEGKADPDKLSPENIDAEIRAAASQPGGLQARRARGALPKPSATAASDDPDYKKVYGYFDQNGDFRPDPSSPTAHEIPLTTTITNKKTGEEVTYPTLDNGSPDLRHPLKKTPAGLVPIAQILRESGFPDTLTNEVYKRRIANNSVRGAAQMTDKNIVDSMKAEIEKEKAKGVTLTPEDALERVKMARPAELQKIKQTFSNSPEVKPMIAAGGMIDGYSDISFLKDLPQAERTAQDDEAVIAGLGKINTPSKASTDADRKALRDIVNSLEGDIQRHLNYWGNKTKSGITDEKLKAAFVGVDRIFQGSRTGYDEAHKAAIKAMMMSGATEQTAREVLGENRVEVTLAAAKERAAQRAAEAAKASGKPVATPAAKPGAPAAAKPTAGGEQAPKGANPPPPPLTDQHRKEIAALPEAARGTDGRIKIAKYDKAGNQVGEVLQIEPDFYSNLKSKEMAEKGWKVYGTP